MTANTAATQYWFAYRTSQTALTSTTTRTGGLTEAAATPVNAPLTGLRTRITYYFQLVASNAAATISGTVLSFTTQNCLPGLPFTPCDKGVRIPAP